MYNDHKDAILLLESSHGYALLLEDICLFMKLDKGTKR